MQEGFPLFHSLKPTGEQTKGQELGHTCYDRFRAALQTKLSETLVCVFSVDLISSIPAGVQHESFKCVAVVFKTVVSLPAAVTLSSVTV